MQEPKKDYDAVRKAIENLLDAEDYDDGSYGELLLLLVLLLMVLLVLLLMVVLVVDDGGGG